MRIGKSFLFFLLLFNFLFFLIFFLFWELKQEGRASPHSSPAWEVNVGDATFPPLYASLWKMKKAWQALVLGLQIHFSEEASSQIRNLQIMSMYMWIKIGDNGEENTIGLLFFLLLFLKNVYLFIWLHQVLVVSCGIFAVARAGSSSLNQGSNPGPLRWECGVLATGPPGKSCFSSFLPWWSPWGWDSDTA